MGVNYAERARNGVPVTEHPPAFVPPHCLNRSAPPELSPLGYASNDLTWYANIPVPTSYMCLGSKEDRGSGRLVCSDRSRRTNVLRQPDGAAIENPKAFLSATARSLALNLLRHQRYERLDGLEEIDASSLG